MEKQLNIITSRAFLSETAARGASLLLGCQRPLGARDPLSTELCCHTVVDLFNYILKMTPAVKCCCRDPEQARRNRRGDGAGFRFEFLLPVKFETVKSEVD